MILKYKIEKIYLGEEEIWKGDETIPISVRSVDAVEAVSDPDRCRIRIRSLSYILAASFPEVVEAVKGQGGEAKVVPLSE